MGSELQQKSAKSLWTRQYKNNSDINENMIWKRDSQKIADLPKHSASLRAGLRQQGMIVFDSYPALVPQRVQRALEP